MRQVTGFVVVLLAASTFAFAQEEPSFSHQEAAKELLTLMELEAQMAAGVSAMTEVMIQQDPTLGPYRDVIMEWGEMFLTWEVAAPFFIDLYVEAFSESELREIAAFYSTSTGRKTLRVLPELLQQQALFGAEQGAAHQDELVAMLRARAAELEAAVEER